MMNLKVRLLPAPSVPGGIAAFLCDERGTPLPNQYETVLHQEAGSLSTITVTFNIDGEHVEIEGSDA